MTEREPKLRTRYVGRDDIPTKLVVERTVHDYENQSTKTADDDIKIGVTMLEMEDMRVKEHFIQNSVRITSWNQMREEILEITRTQPYIDSQQMPLQLGAIPKSKELGQRQQRQRQRQRLRMLRAKRRPRMPRTNRPRKQESDDQRKCFCWQKDRPRERPSGESDLKDLADAEEKPVAASPTSTRHSSGRARLQCSHSQARDIRKRSS